VLRRSSRRGGAIGAALLAAVCLGTPAWSQGALSDYAQPALQDFSATGTILQKNDAELRKIDNSYVQSHRFRESLIRYKEPMKLRVESKAGFLTIRYIINGKKKSTQGLGLRKVKDITGRPGEEQSLFDSGILTPGFLADGVASRFLGKKPVDEKQGGLKVPVFELWFTDEPNSRHHFVWIDPAKRVILRRDIHHRRGGVKMRFLLKEPAKVAGIWVPTRVEVYNAEGRLAGVTKYSNIKINTGLDESLFRI
jgi:hypothetical protein